MSLVINTVVGLGSLRYKCPFRKAWVDVSDAEAREAPLPANANYTQRQSRQDRQLKDAFLALARGCTNLSFICPFTLHLAELKHDGAALRVRKLRGGAPVAQCKLGSLRSGARKHVKPARSRYRSDSRCP